jgi:hypothetical protein
MAELVEDLLSTSWLLLIKKDSTYDTKAIVKALVFGVSRVKQP